MAFYLHEHGWSEKATWGREVTIPKAARTAVFKLPRRETGCRAERALTQPLPLDRWRKLGVRALGNRPLPGGSTAASLVTDGARFFLVYKNYEALLAYNCATSYAISVAMLSDRLK